MSLDKATLQASVKAAFLAAKAETNPLNFDASMTALASDIANAVEVFVKSGTVNTTVTTPDTINGTGVGSVT